MFSRIGLWPSATRERLLVATDDLIATGRILPDRPGDLYYLQHSPSQQWYLFSVPLSFGSVSCNDTEQVPA